MALENLGETFLTVAQNQNLELVTLILEVTGPDIVHSRSIPGETALHLSIAFVSRDNTEVMEFLLASGANVNAVDTNGCTPLFCFSGLPPLAVQNASKSSWLPGLM